MEAIISLTLVLDTASPSLPEYPGVKKYLKGKRPCEVLKYLLAVARDTVV